MKRLLLLFCLLLISLILPYSNITIANTILIPKKVTDESIQVKSEHTKQILLAQGINPDYVELIKDYGKTDNTDTNPYSITYRDRISGKYILEVQQLPMVDNNGIKVNAEWSIKGNIYESKNNLFFATVDNSTVNLMVKNDQPDGKVEGDKLSFTPQLFLNGIEIPPITSKAILLNTDPQNPDLNYCTLEWDYGICKRWLRLIPGKIQGFWSFNKNPNGNVRIKYNQTGDFSLDLSCFSTGQDEETIPQEYFNNPDEPEHILGYPLVFYDSDTFYPDAGAGGANTSVDGRARHQVDAGTAWTNLTNGVGTASADTGTQWF